MIGSCRALYSFEGMATVWVTRAEHNFGRLLSGEIWLIFSNGMNGFSGVVYLVSSSCSSYQYMFLLAATVMQFLAACG